MVKVFSHVSDPKSSDHRQLLSYHHPSGGYHFAVFAHTALDESGVEAHPWRARAKRLNVPQFAGMLLSLGSIDRLLLQKSREPAKHSHANTSDLPLGFLLILTSSSYSATVREAAMNGMDNEDPYFERALQTYREESGDRRQIVDLESSVQEAIRHRAQRLRAPGGAREARITCRAGI